MSMENARNLNLMARLEMHWEIEINEISKSVYQFSTITVRFASLMKTCFLFPVDFYCEYQWEHYSPEGVNDIYEESVIIESDLKNSSCGLNNANDQNYEITDVNSNSEA